MAPNKTRARDATTYTRTLQSKTVTLKSNTRTLSSNTDAHRSTAGAKLAPHALQGGAARPPRVARSEALEGWVSLRDPTTPALVRPQPDGPRTTRHGRALRAGASQPNTGTFFHQTRSLTNQSPALSTTRHGRALRVLTQRTAHPNRARRRAQADAAAAWRFAALLRWHHNSWLKVAPNLMMTPTPSPTRPQHAGLRSFNHQTPL